MQNCDELIHNNCPDSETDCPIPPAARINLPQFRVSFSSHNESFYFDLTRQLYKSRFTRKLNLKPQFDFISSLVEELFFCAESTILSDGRHDCFEFNH